MSQTSVQRDMTPGRLGLAAEPFNPSTIETKVQPAGKSYFGRMVSRDGVSEDKIVAPAGAASNRVGVVVSTHSLPSNEGGDDPHYAAQDSVMVMNKGRIYVAIEEDIAVGDDVYFRHTAGGGGTKLGAFRNDADTATADQLTNARWIKGGTAAEGIALLELDVL